MGKECLLITLKWRESSKWRTEWGPVVGDKLASE